MTLVIIIIILALIFDYINGFHDAANSIATIVSTKVLTPFQAVIWAALFNFAAYFIFKDHGVANTVAKTVKTEYITLYVVLAGLIASIIWNLLTWWFGIPSSSSHTLIGGLAGAAIANGGFGSINMASNPNILQTASFIFIAPIVGMILAFVISLWFLLSFRKDFLPRIVSIGMILLVIWFLRANIITDRAELAAKTHYDTYFWQVVFYAKNFKWFLLAFILLIFSVFTFWLNTLNAHKANVWFKRLQLISSAAFSIGHGGNDAQKVMGIIMATLVASNPAKYSLDHMIWWVPLACYAAIGLGTMSGGWKIVKTMGTRITKVTPFEGVAAETAGAITLFVTEALKIPVSTTHTITGSIMGVGATKRLSAVRWGVTINLLWAWILTIPISALLAAGIFYIVRMFG
ncbi:MAG TPA: inorganic phosphate transporter [Flavisolibacter sp.]|jgi:PiT family inorganic phosphate transporter|nr:inorganic phosphate transporter [Flavisolibacter sp.]